MNIHCDLAAIVFVVAKLDSVPASVVAVCFNDLCREVSGRSFLLCVSRYF